MSLFSVTTTTVIVVTLLGVAVGRWPGLKMNRATIALVGATTLIALGALPLEAAYAAIDWDTLLLLFGMMVLNVNLRRAGFFQRVTTRILAVAKTPRRLLALLIAMSGVFSAIFLNDTIVLVFTPLVLDMTTALRRNPLPYLVALVTSANVGSVATLTGNPQNMLIGVSSGIGFLEFTRALGPLALLGMGIIWLVIIAVYRTEFRPVNFQPLTFLPQPPSEGGLLKALLAVGVMLAALIAGVAIPLAAALAAALLLITRRQDPAQVFQEIDWSLLVFFSALFVVTGAITHAGLGENLWQLLRPYADAGPAALTGVAVVLSNLVSNVPAVMLFRPIVPTLSDPQAVWLTLAMATTFAGNLTLIGSVANLIVAELARSRGVQLSFSEYLKAGTPIAILTLGLGVIYRLDVFT